MSTYWSPKPLRPASANPIFEMVEPETVVKGLSPMQRQRLEDGTPITRQGPTALRPADPELVIRPDLAKGSYAATLESKSPKYGAPPRQDPQEPLGVIKSYLEKAKEHENPKGGLSQKGREHFNKEEGSNLKPGVKGSDDEISDSEKRRKGSFLTRHYKGEFNASKPLKNEKGEPTRHALQATAWGEPVPKNDQDRQKLVRDGERLLAEVNKSITALTDAIDKAELSSKKRAKLHKESFVFPKERSYPIHDEAHARNALARVAQHGTPEEQKKVRAAVAKKYPGIEVSTPSKKKDSGDDDDGDGAAVDKAIPKKYHAGMRGKELAERKKEISARAEESHKDPKSYRPFKTDEGHKTKKSKHTRAFEKKYGKDSGGSVANVAKVTGISKDKLQEVYDRGMAAWRTGHRPGASQHAWAMARVYSFVTGGKTAKTADADLKKKSKVEKSIHDMFRSIVRLSKACGADYGKALEASVEDEGDSDEDDHD
jgi:hypothetical protein